MENKGPYYLTTAIAYTSGKPHIGNVYEIVLADAIARTNMVKKSKNVRIKKGFPQKNLWIVFPQS